MFFPLSSFPLIRADIGTIINRTAWFMIKTNTCLHSTYQLLNLDKKDSFALILVDFVRHANKIAGNLLPRRVC